MPEGRAARSLLGQPEHAGAIGEPRAIERCVVALEQRRQLLGHRRDLPRLRAREAKLLEGARYRARETGPVADRLVAPEPTAPREFRDDARRHRLAGEAPDRHEPEPAEPGPGE